MDNTIKTDLDKVFAAVVKREEDAKKLVAQKIKEDEDFMDSFTSLVEKVIQPAMVEFKEYLKTHKCESTLHSNELISKHSNKKQIESIDFDLADYPGNASGKLTIKALLASKKVSILTTITESEGNVIYDTPGAQYVECELDGIDAQLIQGKIADIVKEAYKI